MVGSIQLKKIETYVREGWGGRSLASYLTSLVDNMLFQLMPSGEIGLPFAIFATGSYGRGELCPGSDVDIMLFSADMKDTSPATKFLYKLWDSGLQVSHSFRTPGECLGDALSDLQIRTSMLEARFVCGNPEFEVLYHEEVLQKIRARKKKEYVAAKLKEIRDRHRKQGNSPFLLQPNIKESRGGLRDVHNALWLTSVLFKYGELSALDTILGEDDLKKYVAGYDFLIRMRFVIHLLCGRKNDRLLFELQEDAAEMIGIRRSKKFTAVERMMRYYFMKAGTISSLSDRIFRLCAETITRRRISLRIQKVNADFSIAKDKIISRSDDIFKKNPARMIAAFLVYANTGNDFSEHLWDIIRRNVIYVNDAVRKNREAVHTFLMILGSERVGKSLRIMHEMGVLGKFIPEFGSLRYLLVNNYYHEYPVDEHSLNCVDRLEKIRSTKDEKLKYLKEILNRVRHKELLYLSLLLHDIGKSKGRYHEREGYKNIKNISDRFHLMPEEREFIESLVKNHVLMSDFAFKHDIDSPDVVASFAEKVMTEERLNAIYLMTYADMSSVSSNFWTQWRASVLHALYSKTRDYLLGIRVSKEEFIKSLLDQYDGKKDIKRFIDVMPGYYFISSPSAKIIHESVLYFNAVSQGFAIHIHNLDDGTTELTIGVRDRRGIFSDIVSVFTVRRLNIIEAKLFTSKDGFAVDRIKVSNWKELWWQGMDQLIESELRDVILGGKKYIFNGQFKKRRGIESFIEADNESLDKHTVIEIMAPDREGFLYDVTSIISSNDVNISSGKIYTEQDIANDTFYVNIDGERLKADTLHKVMGELWQSIRYQSDI